MKEVIRVNSNKTEELVKFTSYLDTSNGWVDFDEDVHYAPEDFNQIVYLGYCNADGHMFAAYYNDCYINIYKGHLNSGKY